MYFFILKISHINSNITKNKKDKRIPIYSLNMLIFFASQSTPRLPIAIFGIGFSQDGSFLCISLFEYIHISTVNCNKNY